MRITVRFDRQTTTNNDGFFAVINFPFANNKILRLVEQVRKELNENYRLHGLFRFIDQEEINDDLFCVWCVFDWRDTLPNFREVLQKTYDEHGMTGDFTILDHVDYIIRNARNDCDELGKYPYTDAFGNYFRVEKAHHITPYKNEWMVFQKYGDSEKTVDVINLNNSTFPHLNSENQAVEIYDRKQAKKWLELTRDETEY